MSRIILLALLLLAGCSHEAALKSPDGKYLGQARMEVHADDSMSVTVFLDDKEYTGKLEEHKVDESRAIAARYGVGSRQYQNYSRGWVNHLRRGNAVLMSNDGEALNCEFTYRGSSGKGTCTSEHKSYVFVLEGQSV